MIICILDALFFSDFSAENLGVHIILETYIISFFSSHMSYHIQDGLMDSKFDLWSKLIWFMPTEKYPLECVFIDNLVSPNVSLVL